MADPRMPPPSFANDDDAPDAGFPPLRRDEGLAQTEGDEADGCEGDYREEGGGD
jgi:hypothetical protein